MRKNIRVRNAKLLNIFRILAATMMQNTSQNPLFLVWRLKKGRALGGADVKIISSLAFAVGARRALAALAVAAVSCLCVFAIRRFAKNRAEEKTLPLVPFIAAGTFISMLL